MNIPAAMKRCTSNLMSQRPAPDRGRTNTAGAKGGCLRAPTGSHRMVVCDTHGPTSRLAPPLGAGASNSSRFVHTNPHAPPHAGLGTLECKGRLIANE
jgi:hypothetical protein